VILLAGGGVRGLKDLESLAGCGCDGALVATALHDGRLGAADLMAALKHQTRPHPTVATEVQTLTPQNTPTD
jgi:phosphoribosylformimino-5-aminoimidazole carboxamide ribotide isomerase